jgi:hypothetical protein
MLRNDISTVNADEILGLLDLLDEGEHPGVFRSQAERDLSLTEAMAIQNVQHLPCGIDEYMAKQRQATEERCRAYEERWILREEALKACRAQPVPRVSECDVEIVFGRLGAMTEPYLKQIPAEQQSQAKIDLAQAIVDQLFASRVGNLFNLDFELSGRDILTWRVSIDRSLRRFMGKGASVSDRDVPVKIDRNPPLMLVPSPKYVQVKLDNLFRSGDAEAYAAQRAVRASPKNKKAIQLELEKRKGVGLSAADKDGKWVESIRIQVRRCTYIQRGYDVFRPLFPKGFPLPLHATEPDLRSKLMAKKLPDGAIDLFVDRLRIYLKPFEE